jgi:hypothetical protein
MTRGGAFWVAALALSACGGGTTEASGGSEPPPPGETTGGDTTMVEPPPPDVPPPTPTSYPGATQETALQVCGAAESYDSVAAFACADGSTPLGGERMRGAQARVGNVGAGPDGHILDLYEVPCPEGGRQMYVDMYHCPGGNPPY